jgi:uncharacterized membrane protein
VFCSRCGARQPVVAPPRHDRFSGLTPRNAAILCYIPVVGWIGAIVVLAADKFRDNRVVRFHAFQGLYLFVAWLIVNQVVSPMMSPMEHILHVGFSAILHLLILFMWIFMIVKASHGEAYSLPLIGELAEKSVAER